MSNSGEMFVIISVNGLQYLHFLLLYIFLWLILVFSLSSYYIKANIVFIIYTQGTNRIHCCTLAGNK